MIHRIVCVAGGMLLGLTLTEVGLRVYFHEHEANRNYWGRYAFVEDDVLPYRHAPSSAATAGREGSFGPHRIATNRVGFRDHRTPGRSDTPAPRIVVAGASFIFGLGVDSYEDLFHVRLEDRLRRREGCPKDLEVFNIAQTGFELREIAALAELEVDRFKPRLVLLALRAYGMADALRSERLDVVNGYRLDKQRWLPDTWLDVPRTYSYLWMRLPRVPDPLRAMRLERVKDTIRRQWQGIASRAARDTSTRDTRILDLLTALHRTLDAEGAHLVCMVIYRTGDASCRLGDMLRQGGLAVIDLHPRSAWCLPREAHWNGLGHDKAAEYVAHRIPLARLRVRGSEGKK